jgi:hypothetical protein
LLGAGWRGNGSNIYISRRQEGEVRRRLNKVLGFIWRGRGSNIYVSRRQEGADRHRLNKVLGFILSRQRVFLEN